MEFDKVPVCQFVPPLNFSPVETEIIDAEISKLLSKGLIVNTIREPNDYVPRIFTRTKKDCSYRMIINLKTFDEFLKFKDCKESPAVRVFTKILAPPFKYLRSKRHLSLNCIDDSVLLGEIFEICFNNIRATVALLQELGFTIHPENLVLVPTQQIIFLGFVTDSVKMTIILTEERKKSIYILCQNILSN